MNRQEYHAFTYQLQAVLQADERVMGLVAVGSMADISHAPDEWSDHDFFVITRQPEDFRSDLSWLPEATAILFSYRETAHGVKVVYDTGHLLEFAVFHPDELQLARVNDYRVLIDRADIRTTLAGLQQTTAQQATLADDHFLFGQLLTHLLVGTGRYARGEHLSGHIFIKHYAVADLLTLLARHLPTANHAELDNLDPFRRFERAYPVLGARINAALLLTPPQAAREILAMAEEHLAHLPDYPGAALALLRSL